MRLSLLCLVLLAGCRLEDAPAPADPADAPTEAAGAGLLGAGPDRDKPAETGPELDADDGGVEVEGPPVVAGDTARVTPDQAATADGGGRPRRAASGWVVPVVGVAPADLVDTFQAARSQGRTHNAIDILAPRGTPVVAAQAGRVARLFTSEKGGLTVYVMGADRQTVTYYAHLDAYADGLADGQRLRAGDPVGTVGDSGNAAPGNTHLHFAIWRVSDPADFWDGEPVNPYPVLSGAR